MTYWLYQHMGNLSPQHLARTTCTRGCARRRTGRECSTSSPTPPTARWPGTRWSYCRDFGRTRLVMVDSRAGRVLDPPDERSMLDPEEWRWLEEHVTGDFDHVLIGTSLPFLLTHGLQSLEAWNEAVCNGAWGRTAARRGRADPPGG